MIEFFIAFIYQPFLNILVFFYWFLGFFSEAGVADMGMAVILFAVLIRLVLLPLSLSGKKSAIERREIAQTIAALEQEYENRPDEFRQARKKIFDQKRGVLAGEMIALAVQVGIALILWKVFETGVTGADDHLLYRFMPAVEQPFNLLFLDRFDLSRPSLLLNFILAGLIFVFETIAVLTSPYPPTRGEVVRLQLTLPLVSFLFFLRMPAGKTLFVMVTMLFSIAIAIGRFIYDRFMLYKLKVEEREQAGLVAVENQEQDTVIAE